MFERFPAIAEAPDLRAADRAVRAGGGRHAVVGRGLGRAALCRRPDRETADAAAVVLSFRALARGMWVFIAFLVSCTLLMAMSWIVAFDPSLTLKPRSDLERGIFVKNYIDQSQEFALCAVALAYPVVTSAA